MLADDDSDDRYFFDRATKGLSFAVNLKTVVDGERLMNYLSVNADHLPDVLFLDINMPRKNGLECLQEIKSNKKLMHLPVVIYSTSNGDGFIDTLYQNGAHYYLHKSDYNELTKLIEEILGLLSDNPVQPSRDMFMFSLHEV